MFAGFAILFFLILFIGGWAISVFLFWFGSRKKSPTRITLGTLGIGVMTLGTLLVLGTKGYDYYRSHSPRCVFEDTFGEKPASDVSVISGIRQNSLDSESVDIRFKTSHSTFLRLLQKRCGDLQPTPFSEFQDRSLASFLNLKPDSEIYSASPVVFSYNPESGIAVFHEDYH